MPGSCVQLRASTAESDDTPKRIIIRGDDIPDGVYAGSAILPGIGERFPAAVNIGFSPTFDRGGSPCRRVEAHLIGFAGTLYGERLEVELFSRLREERRFDSPELLARQIRCDAARTMEVFRRS